MAAKQSGQVVVINDPRTYRSTLFAILATEQFPKNVPCFMLPGRLPIDYFPDCVPISPSPSLTPPPPLGTLFLDLVVSRVANGHLDAMDFVMIFIVVHVGHDFVICPCVCAHVIAAQSKSRR